LDADGLRAVEDLIVDAGGKTAVHAGSIADPAEASALVDLCLDRFGRIDALVNNAAIMHTGTVLEDALDDYERLIRVNVLGTVFPTLSAARAMAAAGSGRIVNVTSTAHLGRAGTSAYAATKGAVASLTYGWAVDLADKGVKVNAIAPSALTPMVRKNAVSGVDYSTLPQPDQIAPLAVYLMSDRVRFTGQVLRLEKRDIKVMSLPSFPPTGIGRDEWSAEDVAEVLEGLFNHSP